MNKCKNCKYFKINTNNDIKPYQVPYKNENYGSCSCEKFIYGYTNYKDTNNVPTDNFYYEDYESYCADFEVGKDFGCIHFKKEE